MLGHEEIIYGLDVMRMYHRGFVQQVELKDGNQVTRGVDDVVLYGYCCGRSIETVVYSCLQGI